MPLSTNWFKGVDGVDNHISEKDGSNATGTGTQALPYQTIEGQIVAGNNIIRSGVYAPAAGGTLDVGGKNLIGDSENVFIYNVSSALNEIETTAGNCTLESLNISGVLFIFDTNTGSLIFKKCIVKDTNTLGCRALGTDRIEGNIFINVTTFQHYSTGYNNPSNFLNNNFINTNIKGSTTDSAVFLKCYFQNVDYTKTSFLLTNPSETITFQDCVFDATSTFEGQLFKDIFLSTTDPNKSPQTAIAESTASSNINKGTFNYTFLNAGGVNTNTIQFVNCYWIDKANPTPVFNDEAGGDYSLTLSSTPQGQSVLYNAGNIIGARPLALTLNADSAPFLTGNGAVLTNITKNGSLFELTTPGEGTVTSVPLSTVNIAGNIVIKLPQRILLTDAIRFFGNLLPQNALSGTGEVVDRKNYDAATNQEVRYTIRLRYWDDDETLGNEVKPAGGGWYEIEHGNIFGVETDGVRGNGDVDVNIVNLTPIFADKFQIEFVLRDNGN